MSRRGTPWLGAHAPRAASSRGWRRSGWRRRPLQPPGQKLAVEPRTCAWCSDSTSAPAEAAGAWLRQASESTTLAEVYMQIADIMHTSAELCLYRGSGARSRAHAHPRSNSCVVSIECVKLLLLSFLTEQIGDCGDSGPRARARGSLTLEFSLSRESVPRAGAVISQQTTFA